jgi:glycosyltransferase involved in cell wall biosynthesis
MKIVQINSTCGIGSTGKICVAVSELLWERDIENYILYAHSGKDCRGSVCYSSRPYIKLQALRARIFGNNGFNSASATRKLISELDRISPDVIHLHNIHSHDCNVEKLFEYLRGKNIKIFWTFHDCWAFTGYCHYFTMSGCDRWQSGCRDCPAYSRYSWIFNRSCELYRRKKKMIEGLDITVITPSRWLADIAKRSFFSDCEIRVINNGIDLEVFKPTPSDVRERYGVGDRFLIMGCSFDWDTRKGIDAFISLAGALGDGYRILLVGTNEELDKRLPKNIISIHRTKDQEELAALYSAADLFVNPTMEENYPTVNLEAIACGTPVLTYNTGGSAEMLSEKVGSVVERGDFSSLEREIRRISAERPFSRKECVAHAKSFDRSLRFAEYVGLYEDLNN